MRGWRPLELSQSVPAAVAVTITCAVANQVLYKMALVPMRRYPFFLAQLTTFGYVLVYFLVLTARVRAGIVTEEMLATPKLKFAAMGLLEALGLATGMAAATSISGPMVTVLSQTFLIWQLLLSFILLRRSYSPGQLAGFAFVIVGVLAALMANTSSVASVASSFQSTSPGWPLLFILSAGFQALSSIIKEGVFKDAARTLPGGSLDIFVVNSFSSGFQALFVFLLLPVLSRIGLKIPFAELPAYFQEGSGCLLNAGNGVPDCEGAPLLPLLYVAANLLFNISLLRLLKQSSAIATSLSMSAAVPLKVLAFTLPLPFLGQPQRLGPGFILGVLLLVCGLVVYNVAGKWKRDAGKSKEA